MGIIIVAKGLQSNHPNSVIENFACNPYMQIRNSNFNTPMQIKYNGDFLYDVNLINNNVCIKITRYCDTLACLDFQATRWEILKKYFMAYIQKLYTFE